MNEELDFDQLDQIQQIGNNPAGAYGANTIELENITYETGSNNKNLPSEDAISNASKRYPEIMDSIGESNEY